MSIEMQRNCSGAQYSHSYLYDVYKMSTLIGWQTIIQQTELRPEVDLRWNSNFQDCLCKSDEMNYQKNWKHSILDCYSFQTLLAALFVTVVSVIRLFKQIWFQLERNGCKVDDFSDDFDQDINKSDAFGSETQKVAVNSNPAHHECNMKKKVKNPVTIENTVKLQTMENNSTDTVDGEMANLDNTVEGGIQIAILTANINNNNPRI